MTVQLVAPVLELVDVGPRHPTAGLDGYPAHDWFAAAGTVVVAPASGVVSKLSGHDPKLGPVAGVHGPFGWSVYITQRSGVVWYLTHLGSRTIGSGVAVRQGQVIGTVGDYARWGGRSHVHQGVHVPTR